ncbi:MAG: phosphoenolpyruvate synthase [Bacteroidales bacterium]|nr:phosphoenolpyruvate synthase [Bacteroidales bacterium]
MAEIAIDSTRLMVRRIRRILLICNHYDSFSLEEDGRLDEQIVREYSELRLSNPPAIVRVESTIDALKLLLGGDRYDLVITMFNAGEMDVFTFSGRMKAICPDTPLVLLTSVAREIQKKVDENDTSNIDYVFCWNSSTDLIIAIIKLIEDKMNAARDILENGVRAILLVEDSIRYYSTYLPLLYKLVLQQNIEALRDALNESQQNLRKRSRPKILMASCYEEALELYEKYKDNLLGVISDVGFVIHKGDAPETEKIDAGIDLCVKIRKDNPTMPILMQSSQESMREVAEKLGVGFVVKTSKTLTHELSEYIGKEFGFGDFVVTDPETGREIGRARDLHEFEKLVTMIPDDVYINISENNYLSKWLYARGLFSVGAILNPLHIRTKEDIPEIRRVTLNTIHDYRIKQALGVVAKFNDDTYNDAIWFARLGDGSLGGKARGLAFLNSILEKHDLYSRWDDVKVMVPKTLVVTTDYFDRFIKENGLNYVINSDVSDAEILSEFVASTLPSDMVASLKVFLKYNRNPLAVRSSSKLEDSYYQPFAGVYSTYMIPDTDNPDQRLRLLSKAIKSVYASVYFASSRGYIAATGNVLSEEKMGIVIQDICGSEDNGYFYPTLSGVARSVNFYPIGYELPEDGVVKLAFGLGKAVVDGENVLRFSPEYPKNVLQTSTPELTMTDTQQVMYALNLQPDKFKTSVNDSINLDRIEINDCGRFRGFRRVVSTWDYTNMRIVDSATPEGPKFVTFAHILKYNVFPLPAILKELLRIAHEEMKCPVEIEFAADLEGGDDAPAMFNVLQIRPISADSCDANVDWTSIDDSDSIIVTDNALGTGWIKGVSDVVYLKESTFDVLRTKEMAAQITELNTRMRQEGRNYVLVGYGRWGSSIDSLGVPVQWGNISEAKVIVETCLKDFRVDPSQGTHFFQNMTSFNVGYINVNPYTRRRDSFDIEKLDAMPAVYETEFVRHVRFDRPLRICIDGRKNRAMVKEDQVS